MVEVAVKAESSPVEKSIFREVSSPAGVPGATLRSRAQIRRPRRLSHIALYTTDVSRKLMFYSARSACDSPTGWAECVAETAALISANAIKLQRY
jgi:hypothetical protein